MDKAAVCEWYFDMYGVDTTKLGGQEYYDSLVALYAEWGVDYVKADDMSRPYHEGEITALSEAIEVAAADGPQPLAGATPIEKAEHVKAHANLWRISPTSGTSGSSSTGSSTVPAVVSARRPRPLARRRHAPPRQAAHQPRRLRGRADGAHDEADHQRVLALQGSGEVHAHDSVEHVPAPRSMMGGHLPENDALTLQHLTNEEVLAVNQASTRNREVLAEGKAVAWAADAADGGTYVALFNRGEAAAPVEVPLAKLGLSGTLDVRDLWKRAPRGEATGVVRADVEPHGAVLLKLVPKR